MQKTFCDHCGCDDNIIHIRNIGERDSQYWAIIRLGYDHMCQSCYWSLVHYIESTDYRLQVKAAINYRKRLFRMDDEGKIYRRKDGKKHG